MEFITAEQFLKQDKEVQNVFIDWWEPSMGDLYAWNYSDESENDLHKLQACTSELVIELTNDNKGINEGNRIPILTEGQLRKFIEDKSSDFDSESEAVIEIEFYTKEDLEDKVTQKEIGYLIKILDKSDGLLIDCCCDLGTDLLQAYWKVAVQIAKNIDN